jgi:hypothetical protein
MEWTPVYEKGRYVKGQLDEDEFYSVACFLEWLFSLHPNASTNTLHQEDVPELLKLYNEHKIEQERMYS